MATGGAVTVGGVVTIGARSLVLNATYEPLCVVTLRRAVVLVLAEKAVVVECTDAVMHSAHASIAVPSVVRLSRYVRVPYRREVPMTRRAILDRDSHLCVYCGVRADTIDHVRPRSRGGQHVWTNVVAACARCNHRKGDRLLSEIGWHLPAAPVQPPPTVAVVMGWTRREPSWQRYLGLPDLAGRAGMAGRAGSGDACDPWDAAVAPAV